jgi:broad specificity phosphatase PhoE
MAETTVVHLLRHGEVHNPDHVLYGRLPGYHLSANGRMMAAAAADFFDGRPVAAIFASPLERAQETAAPVAERLGLEIVTSDRLIESANVLEGRTVTLTKLAVNPGNWRYLWNPFRPSWGEPYTEVVARMREAVAQAREAARGKEAVCVSHQLPIWVSRLAAEHRRLWHNPNARQCALGSVTSFTFDGDQLTGLSYAVPPRRQVADPDRAQ